MKFKMKRIILTPALFLIVLYALPGAISKFLVLYKTFKEDDLSGVLQAIDSMLGEYMEPILKPLEPIIEFLLTTIFPEFDLPDLWQEIFVFMSIYISVQSVDALRGSDFGWSFFRHENNKVVGIWAFMIRFIFGLFATLVAIGIPTALAIINIVDTTSIITFSSIVGLIIFRIGCSIQFAIDMKRKNHSFWTNFWQKNSELELLLLILAPLLLANLLYVYVISPGQENPLGFWFIVAALLLISIFHFLLSKEEFEGNLRNSLISVGSSLLSGNIPDTTGLSGHLIIGIYIIQLTILVFSLILGVDVIFP